MAIVNITMQYLNLAGSPVEQGEAGKNCERICGQISYLFHRLDHMAVGQGAQTILGNFSLIVRIFS